MHIPFALFRELLSIFTSLFNKTNTPTMNSIAPNITINHDFCSCCRNIFRRWCSEMYNVRRSISFVFVSIIRAWALNSTQSHQWERQLLLSHHSGPQINRICWRKSMNLSVLLNQSKIVFGLIIQMILFNEKQKLHELFIYCHCCPFVDVVLQAELSMCCNGCVLFWK